MILRPKFFHSLICLHSFINSFVYSFIHVLRATTAAVVVETVDVYDIVGPSVRRLPGRTRRFLEGKSKFGAMARATRKQAGLPPSRSLTAAKVRSADSPLSTRCNALKSSTLMLVPTIDCVSLKLLLL